MKLLNLKHCFLSIMQEIQTLKVNRILFICIIYPFFSIFSAEQRNQSRSQYKTKDIINENTIYNSIDEGSVDGLVRFFLDINNDEIPDIFVAAKALIGNSNGPFNIFISQENGYKRIGEIELHPSAFVITKETDFKIHRILAFLRKGYNKGTLVKYSFNGTKYVISKSTEITLKNDQSIDSLLNGRSKVQLELSKNKHLGENWVKI